MSTVSAMTVCRLSTLLIVLLCQSVTGSTAVFNISLNPEDQQLNTTQYVLIDGMVKLHCMPGQESMYIYYLPEEDYEKCSIEASNKIIGSCKSSPLVIYINKLKIQLSSLVSYEVGKTYHFGAYTVVDGAITNNSPCLNGIKFMFDVVATLPQDEIKSSSIVLASPSPSVTYVETSSIVPSSIIASPTHSQLAELTTPTMMSSSATLTQSHTEPPLRPTVTPTIATPTDNERPTIATRPDDLNDPIVDGISDHAPSTQSMLSLSLVLVAVTILTLLKLL